MASKHIIGGLPRSTEAPGQRRVIKRLTRKAARAAGRVEATAQLERERVNDLEEIEAVREAEETLRLNWEYGEYGDGWSFHDRYYPGLDDGEMAALETYWCFLEDRWLATGDRLTHRLNIQAA